MGAGEEVAGLVRAVAGMMSTLMGGFRRPTAEPALNRTTGNWDRHLYISAGLGGGVLRAG